MLLSIKRLEMLSSQLNNRGWNIVNEYSSDLYYVADDFVMYWTITRYDHDKPISIEFTLLDFVYYSKELRDINFCVESKNGTVLVFGKLKSDEWKMDLQKWVDSLSD